MAAYAWFVGFYRQRYISTRQGELRDENVIGAFAISAITSIALEEISCWLVAYRHAGMLRLQ